MKNFSLESLAGGTFSGIGSAVNDRDFGDGFLNGAANSAGAYAVRALLQYESEVGRAEDNAKELLRSAKPEDTRGLEKSGLGRLKLTKIDDPDRALWNTLTSIRENVKVNGVIEALTRIDEVKDFVRLRNLHARYAKGTVFYHTDNFNLVWHPAVHFVFDTRWQHWIYNIR